MSELSEKFQKFTGLNFINVDTLLENAANEEEQEKVYDFIAWNVKRGTLTDAGKFKELKEEILSAIGRSTVEEVTEEDPTKYTAAEAAAYNAQLPGAVKAGDVQTPAVEAQEAVEAQNAVYSFESFNNEEKEVKYGEGTVEVTEVREDGATVKVLTNQSTDPNAVDFVGQEFNVNSLDETATLQLFSTQGLAQPIWVTVTKVSDAVEAQEAVKAQEAVYYTEETAAAYNAELDGAVKEGDTKPTQTDEP